MYAAERRRKKVVVDQGEMLPLRRRWRRRGRYRVDVDVDVGGGGCGEGGGRIVTLRWPFRVALERCVTRGRVQWRLRTGESVAGWCECMSDLI